MESRRNDRARDGGAHHRIAAIEQCIGARTVPIAAEVGPHPQWPITSRRLRFEIVRLARFYPSPDLRQGVRPSDPPRPHQSYLPLALVRPQPPPNLTPHRTSDA